MISNLFDKPEFLTSLWGLDWPERFQHPIEEYALIRESMGVLQFSGLEYVFLKGADVGTLLQGLLSHDNLALKPGESSPSWMLDSNGKIKACLHVYRHKDQEFIIQCLPGTAHQLSKTLDMYIFMEDVKLRVETGLKTYSVQGAQAEPLDTQEISFQFPHSRCGEPGFDLIFPPEKNMDLDAFIGSKHIQPIGLTALTIRRVEQMVPWFGVDMMTDKMPLIYGKGKAISYKKGCFLGQETIAMTRDRGRPPMLLCQLESPDNQVPPAGTPLMTGNREAGTLSTVIFSPEYEKPMALGCLQYTLAEPGKTFQDATGQTWTILKTAEWKLG